MKQKPDASEKLSVKEPAKGHVIWSSAFLNLPPKRRLIALLAGLFVILVLAFVVVYLSGGAINQALQKTTSVEVNVLDKISGKSLKDVKIIAAGKSFITDKAGNAFLALPADKTAQDIQISAAGFNSLTTNLKYNSSKAVQSFKLTPSGHIYFLNSSAGVVNVMQSDLDGSDAKIAVAGTGKEDAKSTHLIASPDWKYLALLANRDGVSTKLYIISASDNDLKLIDDNPLTSMFMGWNRDKFVYLATAPKPVYVGGFVVSLLKVFDASSGKAITIDQTDQPYAVANLATVGDMIANISLVDDAIIYTKFWNRSGYYASTNTYAEKSQTIVKAGITGQPKETLKNFTAGEYQWASAATTTDGEIIYQLGGFNETGVKQPYTYFRYSGGKIQPAPELTDAGFTTINAREVFFSPDRSQTLWANFKDNKYELLTGDAHQITTYSNTSLGEYTPFGWYGEQYILLSKGADLINIPPNDVGKELYIAPADYSSDPTKIGNYPRHGQGYTISTRYGYSAP